MRRRQRHTGNPFFSGGVFRRSTGFTLVELVVYLSILAAVIVPFGFVMLRSSRAFSDLARQSHVVSRAPVILDRLVEEMNNGRLLDPPDPVQSPYVRFDRIVDVVNGAPVYGDPIQIDLVPMESSIVDNKDNDGDGIVDEGGVRIWVDAAPQGNGPGSEDEELVIAGNLAKDGLLFTRNGTTMLIDVTFVTVSEPGASPLFVHIGSAVVMR